MQAEHFVVILLTACVIQATCFTLPARTRYCGNNLADALKLACGEYGYNVPTWENNEPDEAERNKHPYMRSLGVVTECCYFGCSYTTLKSYCAYPKPLASKKSSDEQNIKSFDKVESPSEHQLEDKAVKTGDVMGVAPEVGDMYLGDKPVRMGKRARKVHKRQKGFKGRKGRKSMQRRRGGRVPRCRCDTRKKRPKKMELDSIVRSAPVFGTVSPEYLRLPRTLDELPSIHIGMQGY